MPPPASESKPIPQPPTKLSGSSPSPEDQERLQRRLDALLEDQKAIKRAAENAEAALKDPPPVQAPEPPPPEPPAASPPRDEAVDTIARVPDEQLPSHRERQRWSLSKRFSDAMDDLLPKLAVVTQKVNTYTGTDYSGVEALRREIKEQEKLVKARRLAIDSAKQALDTALAHQATSQKEVVALLERKHSWSNGDLERYMALIRSEHINDQAVREAKDAVANAENALEDARAQLEKRERAQYHEEQIWSDTIRRNSTWVTFGLMGVNIFLLLLSLAILEPWRRKRMVREIKTVLETQQKVAMDAASVTAPVAAIAPASVPIDTVIEQAPTAAPTPSAIVEEAVEESPTAETLATDPVEPEIIPEPITETFVDPAPESATSEPELLNQEEAAMTPEERIAVEKEAAPSREPHRKFATWQEKATFIAQDIVSERVISMRRIDYTTAILQGAAAGAVIAATIISMLRPN
ncbi:mitochondrion biogenesis protein She9 [Pyrenophora tritici-repentis]|uniref:Sensitive to high expression protein 9, mitochondrial n=2 Tax=Pyrenophora tritici-repentis TaxID=45151 RepID=A0A2W1E0P7_9PLEO|nr:mitochondrion biogenesis protein (She9) [Pyrenophora tritici-repentis Pt-1C-BFP]KAA8627471.1 Mitochondrion biogenesis protein [Pyrenophora tritici-repentis]EDU41944.1 mitochondrion biogenesis protein (She9) [Pyrenophora tritici-repentis Pt-1C-BFP]KAF7442496.1 Mitochondrion biogenesis protein [Pyrenophora tritici-repentis]KAF7579129.1 mitochondrion biogenesis protein (She9) [Pyrenophora tritici-repentis]KAG9378058.1 Mitochondrion biogenesis protein [Pyrenophora tritici-repentis]